MKTPTHDKQIILLLLSVALAIFSYWIPLPNDPQTPNPILTEAVTPSAPTAPVSADREPATAIRFSVIERVPQTVRHSENLVAQPDDSAKSTKHLIDLPELSNDERNRLNHSKLAPITDKDDHFKH